MSSNGDVRMGPVKRVMVGTDRSITAERAVAWAAAFADRYEADLHIVQVILPGHPDRHAVRGRRGHAGTRRRRRAPDVRHAGRRRTRPRARGDPRRPGDGDRRGDGGARDRRAGGGQRGDGRPQGVPAGQRAEPDQPQRALHGDHREHGGRAGRRCPPAPAGSRRRSARARRSRDRAPPDRPRHEDRDRLREARAEGAVRPAGRRGRRRARTSGQTAARRVGGAGSDVREARADPVDAPRSAPARIHQGARDAAGRRAARSARSRSSA